MKTLSAPVMLSSMFLACWAGKAMAMKTVIVTPQSQHATSDGKAGNEPDEEHVLPPGVVPQPTTDLPGLVVGVSTGVFHTDNVRLAGDDQASESSWVATVRPFIKAAWNGPRFSGELDYTLSGYVYSGVSDSHQVAHHLEGNGSFTIIPQHLFIEGTASYRQQVIDNQLPAGSSRFFPGNNRANAITGTISPYWIQELGRIGKLGLRYTHGRVVYNRDGMRDPGSGPDADPLSGVPNVSSDAVQLSLVSPDTGKWGWSFDYAGQRMRPDFGRELKFAEIKLGISRRLSPRFRLLAEVGKQNQYLSSGEVDELGAGFWNVGFEWPIRATGSSC